MTADCRAGGVLAAATWTTDAVRRPTARERGYIRYFGRLMPYQNMLGVKNMIEALTSELPEAE